MTSAQTRRPMAPLTRLGMLALAALVFALGPGRGPAAQAEPGPAGQGSGTAATTAQRIVSVVPAVTEMLFAVGAGDQVVGVSSFDHYPPAVETRTRVGALVDPDFERILSLRPDLVAVYGTQTDFIARLTRAHVPIFRYVHGSLADILTTMRALGVRVGHARDGERAAAAIEQRLAAIRASTVGHPRPPTALVFNRDAGSLRGIFVSGSVGFLADMLETAGGANAFADVHQSSLQASTEVLLARAPELILELRSNEGWSPARIAEEVAVWNGLPSIPAVRAHHVYLLADDRLLVPGPRVAEGVALMAQALAAARPH
jgi:iron complex transport system substrate-binding protein